MVVNSRPRRFIAFVASLLTAGCVAGPDFKAPAPPDVGGYTGRPLPAATIATPGVASGKAQRFVSGGDIPADWWTLFHSRPLNALIEQALANNPNLKAAQAALLVAHENTRAQHGAYAPKVSAGVALSRERDPTGTLAPTPSTNASVFSLITPQLSVSYVPDVFGLNRRTVEAAAAQEQASRYQLIAADIALSANVAVAAIQEASLEDQVDATRQLIAIGRKMLDILQYQKSKGYAGGLDLAAQQAQLAQLDASLPPLLKQLDQQHDLLATLAGRFPDQVMGGKFTLASLELPSDLPVSLPSVLVARRPDVLQAEANLHAASAQVGIATANRLPNITLTANGGSSALAIGEIFGPGTGFWNIGAALLAPIFDGGSLLHQQRGARAAYQEAAEQYRATVLTAFQNVADTLSALEQDAQGLRANAAAANAAKTSLDLSRLQYKDGYANYLALLSAEQAYQQARIALVQAEANRFADTAALFQALGGGWWHRTDFADHGR
ncbi:MAG: efflux transporter outer membrane subunit [Sphingomonadaceae bacterium]|nr:efflux transporter outer membrane subunit [Sphingomonadaceae bacterium]